jgi:predicted nuclease of predicted toxin-antitoxin system
MRFLIDENLSPRLVTALAGPFPGSIHVESLQLRGCDDARVWATAREGGFVILTKDDDFNARSVLSGAPPKVLHLRVGNADTAAIVALLLDRQTRITAFGQDEETSLLILP